MPITLPTNGIQYCTVDSYFEPSRFVPFNTDGDAFELSTYTPVGVLCAPLGVPLTHGASQISAPEAS